MAHNYRIKKESLRANHETYCDVINADGKVYFTKETTLSVKNIQRLIDIEESLYFDFSSVNASVHKVIPVNPSLIIKKKKASPPAKEVKPKKEVELAEDLKFTLDQLHNIEDLTNVDKAELSDPITKSRSHKIHLTQLTYRERNPGYKSKIARYYEESCDAADNIYHDILNGSLTNVEPINEIVENYIELLTTDMDIMVNLCNYQHPPYKDHIFSHAIKKTLMSLAIGTGANLSRSELAEVGLAAFLADLGLCSINNSMRNSKRKFDTDDNVNIQKHPIFAANIVRSLSGTFASTDSAIFQAHERENGAGYPKKKGGGDIHLFSKIIAISDVYCALISHRQHRKALPPFDAVKTVINMNKIGLFNPHLVNAFFVYTPLFAIGSIVKLTNGMYARVISSNPKSVTHPILRTLSNSIGKPIVERGFEEINLIKSPAVRIMHSVDRAEFDSKLMDGF